MIGLKKMSRFTKNAGRLICLSILALLPSPMAAQTGAAIWGQALLGTGKPAAFSQVRVCPYTGGGVPCSPTPAILFSDAALTHQVANPYTTDQYGNFSVFAAPGYYILQLTIQGSGVFSYLISPSGPSGGSGGVTEIIPGTNVNCTPLVSGHCVGNVTVSASGSGTSLNVKTNGVDNLSQVLLNFTSANGFTFSNPSGGVLSVGVDTTHFLPVNTSGTSCFWNGGGTCTAPLTGFPITLGSTVIAANSTTGAVTGLSVNGVTLQSSGSTSLFLAQDGTYRAVSGGSGCTLGAVGNLAIVFNSSSVCTGTLFLTDSTGADILGVRNTTTKTLTTNQTYPTGFGSLQQQTPWNLLVTYTGPGLSLGADGGWRGEQDFEIQDQSFSRGIRQLLLGFHNCYAIGDCVANYTYTSCIGGFSTGSDEGCGALTAHVSSIPGQMTGTVATGGTGTTTPTLNLLTGGTVFDGGFLIDFSAGTLSCSLAGTSGSVAGSYLHATPISGCTLPLTTARGVGTCTSAGPACSGGSIIKPSGQNTGDTQTVTIAVTLGTVSTGTASFTTGMACLAGFRYPEHANITAAPAPVAGVQTLTVVVRNPNPTGMELWQGGICGRSILVDDDTTVFQTMLPYDAFGSLTGTDLVYGYSVGGTLVGILPNSDGGTPETPTSTIKIYHSAEVVNNPNGSYNMPTIEYNDVVWTPGDSIAATQGPIGFMTGGWFDCNASTHLTSNASCGYEKIGGAGMSGVYFGHIIENTTGFGTYTPTTSYGLTAPRALGIKGAFSDIINIRDGPSQSGSSYNAIIDLYATFNSGTDIFNLFALPICTIGNCTPGAVKISYNPVNGATAFDHPLQTNVLTVTGLTGYMYANGASAVTASATIPWSAITGAPVFPANTPATASQFFTAYNSTTGAFTKAQPAFTDISGTLAAAQCPLATTSAFGCVKPDGVTVTIVAGVISAASSGTVGSGTVDGIAYYTATSTVSSTTAPTTSGHTFVPAWQPSGSAVAPAPLDLATYLASPPSIGGTVAGPGTFTTLVATTTVNSPSYVIPAAGTATNVANFGSAGAYGANGSYWNGSSANTDSWSWSNVEGTGTNPTSTVTWAHTGTSGALRFFLPANTAVQIGTPAYSDTGVAWQATGNTNSYYQHICSNTNAGAAASCDWIVSNDQGTATTFYGDFGINSSAFAGTGSLSLPGATYIYSSDGDMVIGSKGANVVHGVYNSSATDTWQITANGFVLPGVATSPSTATLCPNGTGGALTTTGCATSSTAFQVNGVALTTATTVNYRTGTGNGGVIVTNPSGGNVDYNLSLPFSASGVAFLTYSGTATNGTIVQYSGTAGNTISSGIASSDLARMSQQNVFTGTTNTFKHISGTNASAPTVAAGAGAGTGPTITSTTISDLSGYIQVLTGTIPTASATVVTITFNTAYATAPKCTAWPDNVVTQALVGAAQAQIFDPSTTVATLTQGATPLVAATTYKWGYICTQ